MSRRVYIFCVVYGCLKTSPRRTDGQEVSAGAEVPILHRSPGVICRVQANIDVFGDAMAAVLSYYPPGLLERRSSTNKKTFGK